MYIDLPYYSEWLEYYCNLGVDTFYLYYMKDKKSDPLPNFADLLSFFPSEKIKLKIFHRGQYPCANRVLSCNPFFPSEEWVLHVDSDEFLHLRGNGLKAFLKTHAEYNYFKFNWLMCPSPRPFTSCLEDILRDPASPKYMLPMYKSLVRKDLVLKPTSNAHDFVVAAAGVSEFTSPEAFLIHFCYRGVYDCFNKTASQAFESYNDQKLRHDFLDKTLPHMHIRDIPSRVLVYVAELDNANVKVDCSGLTLNLKNKTNVGLLQEHVDPARFAAFEAKVQCIRNFRFTSDLVLGWNPKQAARDFMKRLDMVLVF